MIKQLLESRLALIQVTRGYNFQTQLKDYEKSLKEYFNEEYTQDEIENGLNSLENNTLEYQYNQEKGAIVLEVKEDYKIEKHEEAEKRYSKI